MSEEVYPEGGAARRGQPHTLRHSVALHYPVGGVPITFIQGLLRHQSLASTGIYTQLADEMTREIALNTETVLGELEEAMEREAQRSDTRPTFEEWDALVSQVPAWL